ncbi:hypothetical protein JTE90_020452 [Oedothorax gibbosus]|uniref:Ionotropic receptor n=1 Tax=Oedothorax gibbosus TaxID=931172 RepID=A0AAV6UCJ4_9ARAC|nr:hypothetical protein JTE90_020452 [Oedothorax gibbosus]
MANRWNASVTTKLRVAYSKLAPFVDVIETDNGDIIQGFMPHILKKVGHMEFTFIREPLDRYSETLENNTFGGMVGMLSSNDVDLIMNPILPQEEFFEFLYYSNPITIEAYTILSGTTSINSGYFFYFSVLDTSVWSGIAVALLSIAAASACLVKYTLRRQSYNYIILTGWYCWNLFSFMLKQNPTNILILKNKKRLSSIVLRVLVMTWAFCIAFLVMNVFQSLLVSKMTLLKSRPLVDTLTDLVACKDCVCMAPREIQLDFLIKRSPLETVRRSWNKIDTSLSHHDLFKNKYMLDVEKGKFCLIHGHLIIEDRLGVFFQKKGSCNLHLSKSYFYPFSLLMAVNRNMSPVFFETFNLGITRLVDADITGRWFKSSLEVSTLCTSYTDNTIKPLGMKNLYGVLLLWAAGTFIAAIVLILEIFLSKFTVKSKKVKRSKTKK